MVPATSDMSHDACRTDSGAAENLAPVPPQPQWGLLEYPYPAAANGVLPAALPSWDERRSASLRSPATRAQHWRPLRRRFAQR
jgi:hypothetical protein